MKAKIVTYTENQDPVQAILEEIGDSLNGIEVFGNRVLVATAPRCERSRGGIIFTDKNIDEERYQGKVGLILKMGEGAFKFDGSYEWVGPAPKVGDWVFYRTPDSWECGVSGVSCRFIRDEYIVGKVNSPDAIW